MISNLVQWFKPAAHRPRRPQAEIDRIYPRFRWQILESAFIAYAAFYVVRNNFAPVAKEIGAALQYDKLMIGNILAVTAMAYGIGKLVMGYFADRSDSRKYVAAAMMLTAACNFLFGGTANYHGHLILWSINGFVQGMGYGPCTRGLSHWYSAKERGAIFGVWNTSHCVGGAIAGYLAAACAQRWGWQSAFYVPGAIATLCGVYLFWRMRDTPQSEGLPPVEEYKNDRPPEDKDTHERELSFREIFLEYILPNKMLWLLAVANIFVYVARYAMVDWGPTYLKEVKGATLVGGGVSTLVIELSGATFMVVMGLLSDRIGGRRARLSALAMIPLVPAFLGLIFSGTLTLTPRDLSAPAAFVNELKTGTNAVSQFVWSRIPEAAKRDLARDNASRGALRFNLATNLNEVLNGEIFYTPDRFAGVTLAAQTQKLLSQKPTGAELVYCNRLLLEDAYPGMVEHCRFTPARLLWVNLLLFGIIGFFVYTPVTFSGVVALDLTSKKAQATAAGFVGLFGYIGRVIEGKGLGWFAQNYGWDAGIFAIIGCVVLGIVLLAFLWNVRPRR